MFARSATLPDAFAIEQLIQVHVADGTLLPRSLAEICENIRDFIVVEDDGEIIGWRDGRPIPFTELQSRACVSLSLPSDFSPRPQSNLQTERTIR